MNAKYSDFDAVQQRLGEAFVSAQRNCSYPSSVWPFDWEQSTRKSTCSGIYECGS